MFTCLGVQNNEVPIIFLIYGTYFCCLEYYHVCTEQVYVSHVMLYNKLNFVDFFFCVKLDLPNCNFLKDILKFWPLSSV